MCNDLHSLRMRSEAEGRHISGAERLLTFTDLGDAVIAMLQRALFHSRVRADSINFQIEEVPADQIVSGRLPDLYNNQVADVVTNKNKIEKISVAENELIRKKDPVFMIPESNIGRAHFYAPVKKINNQPIETILFNIIFIWLTSTILYFALLADVLRKLMNYFENIKLRKWGRMKK